MPVKCASAPRSVSIQPLVAHCIVGALRTFFESQVQLRLRQVLLAAASSNYRVFVVGSLDCVHGAPVGRSYDIKKYVYNFSASCSSYPISRLQAAMSDLPIERIIFEKETAVPAPRCNDSELEAVGISRYTNFYLQFWKTRTCFSEVYAYEQRHNVCFDFVIRSRPDHLWTQAPHVTTLPYDAVSVPARWRGLVNRTSMLEDHAFAVPRPLARSFSNAVVGWDACHPLATYVNECDFPRPGYVLKSKVVPSECILGLYLRSRNLSWRNNPQFKYTTMTRFSAITDFYHA